MNGIRFRLNGKDTCYEGSAADRLLDVLRDEYDMKSVKCGCKEGECGACAVLIDGVLVNSCCVAMGAVDSHEILTVEGYRETARFEALSKAFADLSRCGKLRHDPCRRGAAQQKRPSHRTRGAHGAVGQHLPLYRLQRDRERCTERREGG